MAKLLLLEDDEHAALETAETLRAEGYLVDVSGSVSEARAYLSAALYDLMILDWNLPDGTGPQLLGEIRASQQADVPVLFLTAMSSVADKVEGFERGADDYLTKPFHQAELKARVKALLKRPTSAKQKQLQVRNIMVDQSNHDVFLDGNKVEFFPQEFALLEFLMLHPNQIFSADALLKRVWSTDSESSIETVRVTIMRIRQKLQTEGQRPLISTLRNIGYRLDA
jgi:DNA-binding response OmpR family regulator